VGSAISLTLFLFIGIAGYRRRADTGSRAAIVLAAVALTGTVLVFFAVDTLRNEPETFAAIVAIVALSVLADLVWKQVRGPAAPGVRPS
jgi:peptidoglycan/LPS O-acetylase OafA/YrhL